MGIRAEMTADRILSDVRELSSGTMATLIRQLAVPGVQPGQYEVVERVRIAFAAHVVGVGAERFQTWQDAWGEFCRTPQAAESAAGSSVGVEVRALAGLEDTELVPTVPTPKAAPTFAELFGGTRDSLRRLAESWHRARGTTPTETLQLFASLRPEEEVEVIRSLRAITPEDGEPFEWLVSRRAIAVQTALDRIQEARGLPPIQAGPPPSGYPSEYKLSVGDKLEAQRIARSVVKFFGQSTPAVIIRADRDRDGWHWVRIRDVDGNVLTMGKGGFQVGAVQCCHQAEAAEIQAEIRRALDIEIARVEAVAGKRAEVGYHLSEMPRHIARRLNPQLAAEIVPAPPTPVPEEATTWTCTPRR